MLIGRRKPTLRRWRVFTDGAINSELGLSGLAAVVYDETNAIHLWWYQAAGRMTCNEAEYGAVLMALDQLLPFRPLALAVFSDSQVMVRQMTGEAATRAPALRQLHSALRARITAYEQVSFYHISREENQVADALANEAIVQRIKAIQKASGVENAGASSQRTQEGETDPCVKNPYQAIRSSGR